MNLNLLKSSRRLRVVLFLTALVAMGGVWLWAAGANPVAVMAGASALLVGINTVTYETPVAGTTAPTATQARGHQIMSAVITGDNSATAFTMTHNWNLSTALLAKGFPLVNYEYLLAAGRTAAVLTTSKAANSVVFACTAFTGAGIRITLERPWSALR